MDASRAAQSALDLAPALAPEPQRKLPIVATADFWDYAFERLFGRAAGVAQALFNLALFMAFCYPAWHTILLAALLLLATALSLGWWQRRLLIAQTTPGPATLVDSSGRALKLCDDRHTDGPPERVHVGHPHAATRSRAT